MTPTREERDAARKETMTEKRRAHMRAFLESLARTANVSASAKAAGVSARAIHDWLKQSREKPEDPTWHVAWLDDELNPFHEAYKLAWDQALDAIEASLFERATVGSPEPVFYKGEVVGEVRKRSDLAAFALLRRFRPAEYRENQIQVEHRGKVEIESARDKLAERLMLAIERREQAALAQADPTTAAIDATFVPAALPAGRNEKDEE